VEIPAVAPDAFFARLLLSLSLNRWSGDAVMEKNEPKRCSNANLVVFTSSKGSVIASLAA